MKFVDVDCSVVKIEFRFEVEELEFFFVFGVVNFDFGYELVGVFKVCYVYLGEEIKVFVGWSIGYVVLFL